MSDILTHTLYNLYNAPDGFCFDLLCSDEPIVDDAESAAFNAESRVSFYFTKVYNFYFINITIYSVVMQRLRV